MTPARHHAGSSLIEVLIALGLVAVTMLGLLGLQLRSLGMQKDSLDRKAAAVLVGGLADRVSVNFIAFRDGGYNNRAMGPEDDPPDAGDVESCETDCSEAQVANRDWDLFQMDVRKRLPGGIAYLTSTATNVQITIGWQDPRRTDADSGGEAVGSLDSVCEDAGLTSSDSNADLYRCYAARVTP